MYIIPWTRLKLSDTCFAKERWPDPRGPIRTMRKSDGAP